ncbi:MAG: SDR family NAD(P)-dependent oxidoreductase [Alphaproteobacteria bacterium]|nr:SDR family NAD(P)-dependent oxidoreductase [Alphaproteobacteria bacterium]
MSDPRSLQDRVALITGAGAGLGQAYAFLLAARGAFVVVQDIDRATAEETAAAIQAKGGQACACLCDIADPPALGPALRAAGIAPDGIHILVNNAGIDAARTIEQVTVADFDRMFGVHVKGTFFATQTVIGGMKARQGGKIVNISSINGMIADSTDSHYNGAKAAILGLTKAWAKEFAPWRINVNAVAPGHVVTAATIARGSERMERIAKERIPLGRYANSEEIAHTVAFLASAESDFITGQVVSPNGGEAIVGI